MIPLEQILDFFDVLAVHSARIFVGKRNQTQRERRMQKFAFLFISFFLISDSQLVFVERTKPIKVPQGYSLVEDAPKDAIVSLIIAIKQRNLDLLEVKIYFGKTMILFCRKYFMPSVTQLHQVFRKSRDYITNNKSI